MFLTTLATRSFARSLYSSTAGIARHYRNARWGTAPTAFVLSSSPFHPQIRQRKYCNILVRTYIDDAEDDVALFEEVVEDVKHSSSMGDDIKENDVNTEKQMAEKRKALKKELIQYRIDEASEIGKPAYNIFTNAALEGICTSLPTNEDQLLKVKGIGPKKLEMYGHDIIDIVKKYAGDGELLPEEANTINESKRVSRPEPIKIESLTAEQRSAAEMALDGKSVFISGPAGTGKSHVSKFIIQSLQKADKRISPTAPTGVAAINVGGSTLHSFFGIGLGMGSVSTLVKKIRKKAALVQRINETDVLLIDEVSMLSCDLLEKLDGVARVVRERDEPMGGLQIVAVGDFFQVSTQSGYDIFVMHYS